MKQFIVDRHTTPNTPTLEQVPTEKIPIYENRAAVEADLANLSVGQIVATKDTGDELAQPVDVVEEGNLHAVSSNAVAESLSYSTTEQKTGGVWIDGKPIYRKVISNTLPNSGGNILIGTLSTDIENVVDARFILVGSEFQSVDACYSGGNYTPLNVGFINTAGTNKGKAYYKSYVTSYYGATVVLIAEYTKTTD